MKYERIFATELVLDMDNSFTDVKLYIQEYRNSIINVIWVTHFVLRMMYNKNSYMEI